MAKFWQASHGTKLEEREAEMKRLLQEQREEQESAIQLIRDEAAEREKAEKEIGQQVGVYPGFYLILSGGAVSITRKQLQRAVIPIFKTWNDRGDRWFAHAIIGKLWANQIKTKNFNHNSLCFAHNIKSSLLQYYFLLLYFHSFLLAFGVCLCVFYK